MATGGKPDRFVVIEPSEVDVLEDDLSVSYYRIVDNEGVPDKPPKGKRTLPLSNYPTCCYTRTLADAIFVCRLMNKGAP